jgi:hypothetical protein
LVEVLLHFVVPLAALTLAKARPKTALLAALIALTPDLDYLIGIHRSPTHSALVLGALLLVAAVTLRRRLPLRWVLFAAIGLYSHLLLDLFNGTLPLLWPLLNLSLGLEPSALTVPQQPFAVDLRFQLAVSDLAFKPIDTANLPVATPEGTGIALLLLAGVLTRWAADFWQGLGRKDK